ncbi:MAG: hypothetical protein ABI601_14895 [bacterium]
MTRSLSRFVRGTVVAGALVASLGRARPAIAQRADSARAGVLRPATDSARKPLPKPPLSPRRAFFYSLALPGYAQSVLNRPTAGAIFMVTESIAIAMLRESSADLRQARRFATDSLIVVGFAETGAPITQPSAYTESFINTRRGHVEDWIAFLIANHLFAAADAYVAAHLWDLPSQISIQSRPSGTVVAARLRW